MLLPEHINWVKFLELFYLRNICVESKSWPYRRLNGNSHLPLGFYAGRLATKGPGFFGDIYRRVTDGRSRPIGSCRAAYSFRARAGPGSTPTKGRFTAGQRSNRHCQPNRNTNPNFHTGARSYLHALANLHPIPNLHAFSHSYAVSGPGPTSPSRGNHPHATGCSHLDTASQPDNRANSYRHG